MRANGLNSARGGRRRGAERPVGQARPARACRRAVPVAFRYQRLVVGQARPAHACRRERRQRRDSVAAKPEMAADLTFRRSLHGRGRDPGLWRRFVLRRPAQGNGLFPHIALALGIELPDSELVNRIGRQVGADPALAFKTGAASFSERKIQIVKARLPAVPRQAQPPARCASSKRLASRKIRSRGSFCTSCPAGG